MEALTQQMAKLPQQLQVVQALSQQRSNATTASAPAPKKAIIM